MREISRYSNGIKLDLTPLIDCVFLLIVFFLIAGKIPKQERVLYPPRPLIREFPGHHVNNTYFVNLLITDDERRSLFIMDNEKAETVTELSSIIADIMTSNPDMYFGVFVDCYPKVEFCTVIAALDACYAAGLTDVIVMPPRIHLSEWPESLVKSLWDAN